MRVSQCAVCWIALSAMACIERVTFTPAPPTVPVPRLPQNNAYVGATITADLRPSFAWEPSSVKEGEITYQIEISSDREFAREVSSQWTTEPHYRPSENLQVSTVAPVGRRYYWRVRACVETNCSEPSSTWWINLGRSRKDFNGDGFDDLAIGAWHSDYSVYRDAGLVYVYFGGAGLPFDTTPEVVLDGKAADAHFGKELAYAGDFNGDGFADLLVGTSSSPLSVRQAYLFLGGPGPTLDQTEDVIFSNTMGPIAGIGDVNGDGYDDLAIAVASASTQDADVCVVLGNTKGPYDRCAVTLSAERLGEGFGVSIHGANDLDGDGRSDVVVTSAGTTPPQGRACTTYVYRSGANGSLGTMPSQRMVHPGTFCLERGLASADLDADGRSDLQVSHSLLVSETPQMSKLDASLYVGTSDGVVGPALLLSGGSASWVNGSIAAAGDLNGDGLEDLAFGYRRDGVTASSIHLGRGGGSTAGVALSPDATCGAGHMVAGVGDLNGDGFDDLAIGNPSDPTSGPSAGRAYLYFGGPGGAFDTTPDSILDPGIADSFFGHAIAR